jgi:hypothetical protein
VEQPSNPSTAREQPFPWLMLLTLGPVTTRMVVLYWNNIRAGQFVLAAMCLVGIVSFWYLAPEMFSGALKSIRLSIYAMRAHWRA